MLCMAPHARSVSGIHAVCGTIRSIAEITCVPHTPSPDIAQPKRAEGVGGRKERGGKGGREGGADGWREGGRDAWASDNLGAGFDKTLPYGSEGLITTSTP
eukprot:3804525-Rhodomonas_salina.1